MSEVDYDQRESELDQIIAWRLRELIHAGWEVHRAEQLAKRLDVDLHEAIDLIVAKGCDDQQIALLILL